MEWVGVAMALAGGILLYSAVKNLHPWKEVTATLKTAKLPSQQGKLASDTSGTPGPQVV